jgi:hypothetical protein
MCEKNVLNIIIFFRVKNVLNSIIKESGPDLEKIRKKRNIKFG